MSWHCLHDPAALLATVFRSISAIGKRPPRISLVSTPISSNMNTTAPSPAPATLRGLEALEEASAGKARFATLETVLKYFTTSENKC